MDGRKSGTPIMLNALLLIALAGVQLGRAEPMLPVRTVPTQEYRVKADFLMHLTNFVAWPPDAYKLPDDPFVLGVLEPDPFGSVLEDAVHGQTVGDRAIVIKRYRRLKDVGPCNMLFIPAEAERKGPPNLDGLRDRPILTVGETDDFSNAGGIIRFVTLRDRITLMINMEAAQESKLSISSKLLSVGVVIPAVKR
jgi:hypothetical protein